MHADQGLLVRGCIDAKVSNDNDYSAYSIGAKRLSVTACCCTGMSDVRQTLAKVSLDYVLECTNKVWVKLGLEAAAAAAVTVLSK
jgi:hypothetical protein